MAKDYATGRDVDLSKPEEVVRQEYERVLVNGYGYRKDELDIEVKIVRGSGFFPERADIVVYDSNSGRDQAKNILGIVETKKPDREDGLDQLKSYMTATSAIWGVWTNGDDIAYLSKSGAAVEEGIINDIPVKGQSIQDVGRLQKQTLEPFDRSELRSAFRRIMRFLHTHANMSRREKLGNEMIKIIFAKFVDETTYLNRPPAFRVEYGEKPASVAVRIKNLFKEVVSNLKDDEVFEAHETINLDEKSIAWVVGQLQRGSLSKTQADVVGDAFEIFSESHLTGQNGQFFTPRNVVDIAVKIANPDPDNTICDPACGSGGFLISALEYIWKKMDADPKWSGSPNIQKQKQNLAERCFFGIDKEFDLVKIAKAHMAIAGDGRSSIVHENSLHDFNTFASKSKAKYLKNGAVRQFDIVMTNPPFGVNIKVNEKEAERFHLGKTWKKEGSTWKQTKKACKRDPYILFAEQCLNMLRDKGTLAIVLPETVFHGPSLAFFRQFLFNQNNIKAIIDLPRNTFMPYCGAKTCLLVLEKGTPQQDQIIMATPQEVGHDHRGEPVYKPNSDSEIWDDTVEVLADLDDPSNKKNKHVFCVNKKDVMLDCLAPKVHKFMLDPPSLPKQQVGVTLGDLVADGSIITWDGTGSPSAKYKGMGKIPYIRVADIVNWEMYRNPTSHIPREVYEDMTRNRKIHPQKGDIIFVRRGSDRIGTVAMVSPRDKEVLMTRELLSIRVAEKNKHGIDPFYLLAMLSSAFVQDQIEHLVLVDVTIRNMGKRWESLLIPIHQDKSVMQRISTLAKSAVENKWAAQDAVDKIRSIIGEVTT